MNTNLRNDRPLNILIAPEDKTVAGNRNFHTPVRAFSGTQRRHQQIFDKQRSGHKSDYDKQLKMSLSKCKNFQSLLSLCLVSLFPKASCKCGLR